MIKQVKVIYRRKNYKGFLVRNLAEGGEVRVPVIGKTFELYPPEKFENVFENNLNSAVYILNRRN